MSDMLDKLLHAEKSAAEMVSSGRGRGQPAQEPKRAPKPRSSTRQLLKEKAAEAETRRGSGERARCAEREAEERSNTGPSLPAHAANRTSFFRTVSESDRKRRSMIRTFRYAFILAKIYGMLARTYVGSNYQDLLRLKNAGGDLRPAFPGRERPSHPEGSLPAELEARIVQRQHRSR